MAEKYFPGTGILTKDIVTSGEIRIPIRPLGVLSDLVVDSLPTALALARGGDLTQARGLLDRAEEYAGDLQARGLPQEGTLEHRVGRLDVLMLYAGFAHTGLRINSNLSNLVGAFSRVQIPALTYEDIILNNPQKDPRTFTDQEVGADEEHFYGIHRDLEHVMKPAVIAFKEAILAHLRNNEVNYDADVMFRRKSAANRGLKSLDLLVSNTRTVGRRMEHFDEFRPYLNPIPSEYIGPTLPQKGYAGPSGAFSGTLHSLDLLIEGSAGTLDPTDEVLHYIRNNRIYIPQVDYSLLDEASEFAMRENKRFSHFRDKGTTFLDTIIKYGEKLLMFRRIHLGSVSRQVPSVMKNDEESGTGGINNVAAFLNSRITRTQATLARLNSMRYMSERNVHHF